MDCSLVSGSLRLCWDEENRFLELFCGEDRLFRIPGGKLLVPRECGELASVSSDGKILTLSFAGGVSVRITSADPGFRIQTFVTPEQDLELTRLDLLPEGSQFVCHRVINFRNRHRTNDVWPELTLGNHAVTDTYSTDWQFAPHPSALLFTRDPLRLFWGASEPPVGGYGLYLDCKAWVIQDFSLHYGESGCGLLLKKGVRWTGPEFVLFDCASQDPFDCYAEFGKLLIREKRIADPEEKRRFDWHRKHVYCTWLDQEKLSSQILATDLAAQAAAAQDNERPVFRALNEDLVRRGAAIIRREKLPIGTILLDEGWNFARGQWEAHPQRFPDLRKLVDDLHGMGFRVIVWWNWAEIVRAAESSVAPETLMCGGKRNRHGALMRDYSKKATQAYLRDLFHHLFSGDASCYDLDGIKTDFQADKVHPDLPCEDPSWRGEENYFLHVYRLFMTELRRNKPDGCHIGCAGNYFLSEYIDINRTYDVAGDDYTEHVNRAKMLFATSPGTPVVFDMHGFRSRMPEFLRAAREMHIPVHVGQLTVIRDDLFSRTVHPMDETDYSQLREGL